MSKKVVIFGGTNFEDNYLVAGLAKSGYSIRLISGDEKKANALRLCGHPGQIECVCGSIMQTDKLSDYIDGCDIVINAVRVLDERCHKFYAIHANAVEHLAYLVATKVDMKFIHLSVLGAEKMRKSKYARSRASGDKVVRSVLPNALILKTSILFGRGDILLTRMAHFISKIPLIVPVIYGNQKIQPLYMGDLVDFVIHALKEDKYWGKTLELAGEKVYSILELWKYVGKLLGYNKWFIRVVPSIGTIIAAIFEIRLVSFIMYPVFRFMEPIITRDQVTMLGYGSISDNNFFQTQENESRLKNLEDIVPEYLIIHSKR